MGSATAVSIPKVKTITQRIYKAVMGLKSPLVYVRNIQKHIKNVTIDVLTGEIVNSIVFVCSVCLHPFIIIILP